jgi:hypothetical protein
MMPGMDNYSVNAVLDSQEREEWRLRSRNQLVANHHVMEFGAPNGHRHCQWDSDVFAIGKHHVASVQLPQSRRNMPQRPARRTAARPNAEPGPVEQRDVESLLESQEVGARPKTHLDLGPQLQAGMRRD